MNTELAKKITEANDAVYCIVGRYNEWLDNEALTIVEADDGITIEGWNLERFGAGLCSMDDPDVAPYETRDQAQIDVKNIIEKERVSFARHDITIEGEAFETLRTRCLGAYWYGSDEERIVREIKDAISACENEIEGATERLAEAITNAKKFLEDNK